MRIEAAVLLALFAALTLTPAAGYFEQRLPTHMLVELPLLALIGVGFGHLLPQRWAGVLQRANGYGIPGILLATFALAFWMVPRNLDAAVASPLVNWAKYLSLPLLVGVPLTLSWDRLGFIGRAIVRIEFIAMLLRLGWLYLISPQRLCNSYTIGDQQLLGQACLLVAGCLGFVWLLPLFWSGSRERKSGTEGKPNRRRTAATILNPFASRSDI